MADIHELKRKIPGWGADLDPAVRPGVPFEKTPEAGTGAHWEEPERQKPTVRILVSPEHEGLTPVFGTAQPPKGLSGLVRALAYKYSEGKKRHWLLLLLGDRIDVVEGALASLVTLQAHNPLKERGLAAELEGGAFFTRFGQGRADLRRQALVGAAIGIAGILLVRSLVGSRIGESLDRAA